MAAQGGIALDRLEGDRPGKRPDGLYVHHAELARGVGVVRVIAARDLDDADDRPLLAGMVEEGLLAHRHLHQTLLGGMVAYAVPERSGLARFELLRKRPARGFAFDQPMCHRSYPVE